jgi:hypothetical protein
MRIAPVILLVAWQHVARADDCPLTADDAAGGTWTSRLAEDMDACMYDPDCNTKGLHFGNLPTHPRTPHGTFLVADADTGLVGRARDTRTTTEGVGAFLVGGDVHAGWHRGVQACASTHAELGTETNVSSSFGVAFPWMFTAVAIGGTQDWHVRPALSSPRIWARRVYSTEQISVDGGVVVWRGDDGARHSALPFHITSEMRDQDDGIADRAIVETPAFGAYAYAGDRLQLEVARTQFTDLYARGLPADINAPQPAPDMSIVRFDPLVLRTPLGATMYGAVSGGWIGGHRLHCQACAPAVGSLELGTTGRDAWTVRAERTAQLAIDGRIVVEDRLTAGVHHMWSGNTLRAGAFTALTRTTAAGEDRIVATGGGAVGLDVPLVADFAMSADVEAGRTYYARLDADPTPRPETAARAELRLQRRFQYIPK